MTFPNSVPEYSNLAKGIIQKHRLDKFLQALFTFWEKSPPTLGHGFYHVLKVAVLSYIIGNLNDYPQPENLFIGSLFHDIHRPALGQDGAEDQTKGAKFTEKIFTDLDAPTSLISDTLAMINEHDNWRNQDDPPLFSLFISVADKASHDIKLINGYIWSSNHYLHQAGMPLAYTNHLKGLTGFVKYQQRAWEIFYRYYKQVAGMDQAINAYIELYKTLANNLQNDPLNKNYLSQVQKYALICQHEEYECLKSFIQEEEKVQILMSDSQELHAA